MRPVLILGGYGNFGKRIAEALVRRDVPVIIAGRDKAKALALKNQLNAPLVTTTSFDAFKELGGALDALKPSVVINTCGPFQTCDYEIAACCIEHNVHYIDLADGRAFVAGITALDSKAKEHGVAVISGASTVPGLSSAVLDHYRSRFSKIDNLRYGISPGQKAERGLATTKGILTYVGRPLAPVSKDQRPRFGWQDIYRQRFPTIGARWMANCDIPDLDLFAERYDLGDIRFSAGLELGFLHLGLWGLSWLVRFGLPINLPARAGFLLKASNWFDGLGTADGGMYVMLSGRDLTGQPLEQKWFIEALDGYGPHIPTVPAIVLADKLARGELRMSGALPCIGLVTLEDYLAELAPYPIRTYLDTSYNNH